MRESNELGGTLGGTSLDDEAATDEDDEGGTGVRVNGFGPLTGRLGRCEGEVKLDTVDDLRSEAGLT